MSRNNQLRNTTPVRRNYKLYKVKKQWVTACATFLVAFGAMAATNTAWADPATTAQGQAGVDQTTETSSTSGSTPTSTAAKQGGSAASDSQAHPSTTAKENSQPASIAAVSAASQVSSRSETSSVAASQSKTVIKPASQATNQSQSLAKSAKLTSSANSVANSQAKATATSSNNSEPSQASSAKPATSGTATTTLTITGLSSGETANVVKTLPVSLRREMPANTTKVSTAAGWTAAGVAPADQVALTKTITRTIKMEGLPTAHPDIVQSVTFNRTAIVDNNTHKVVGWVNPNDADNPLALADGDQAWTGGGSWASVNTTFDHYVVQYIYMNGHTSPDYSSSGFLTTSANDIFTFDQTNVITSIKAHHVQSSDSNVSMRITFTSYYFYIDFVDAKTGRTIGHGVAVEGPNFPWAPGANVFGGYVSIHPISGLGPGIDLDNVHSFYYGYTYDAADGHLPSGFKINADGNVPLNLATDPNNHSAWTPNFRYDGTGESGIWGKTFNVIGRRFSTNTIKFVDANDTSRQIGASIDIPQGKITQTVTFAAPTVPDGYVLAAGQTLPTSYTYTADQTDTPILIRLVNKGQDITISGPAQSKDYDGNAAQITATQISHYINGATTTNLPAAVNNIHLTADDFSFADTSGNILATPPTNVGTYHIVLNSHGLQKFRDADSEINWSYDPTASFVVYRINNLTAKVHFQAVGTKTYDGSNILNSNDNTTVFTTAPAVTLTDSDGHLVGSPVSFLSGDFQFVDAEGYTTPVAIGADNTITGPVNAGTYSIQLTKQGIERIEAANPNYQLDTSNIGSGTLTITKAQLSLGLTGGNGKTYDGQAVTADDLLHGGTIAVILTYPQNGGLMHINYAANTSRNYAEDYTWNTTGNLAPQNAGSYTLSLKDNSDVLGLLTYAIEHSASLSYLNGNVDLDHVNFTGTASYTISRRPLTVMLSGSGSTTYTGDTIATPTDELTNHLTLPANSGLVSGDSFVKNGLQDSDFVWYDADHHRLTTGNPTAPGTYYLALADNDTNLANANPNYAISASGFYKYVVNQAAGTITFDGSQTDRYSGRAHPISGYYLDISGVGIGTDTHVTVSANDVEFSSDNGQHWSPAVPVNAGTYQVRLTEAGLSRVIASLKSQYPDLNWDQNVYGRIGTAATFSDYQITPMVAQLSLSGSNSKTYDGQQVSFDYNSSVNTANLTSTVASPTLPHFVDGDFAWYEGSRQLTTLPTNAGTYTIKLTDQGLRDIQRVNPNYTYTLLDNGYTYTINKATATITFANNNDRQTAWTGQPAVIDPAKYVPVISTSNSLTLTAPTGLTAGDYQFYDRAGHAIGTPTEVGDYQLGLNAAGLAAVESDTSNYTWVDNARADFQITKAAAVATLVGSASVTFNGRPVSIPTNSDGTVNGITVSLSNGRTYALKPTDLEFVSRVDDHYQHAATPISAGTYLVRLTSAGIANIAAAADGAHYDYSSDNVADFIVRQADYTVPLNSNGSGTTYSGSPVSFDATNNYYTMQLPDMTGSEAVNSGDLVFVDGDGNVISAPTTAGTYDVTFSDHFKTQARNEHPNYNLKFATSTFTISPQQIVLTLNGSARKVADGRPAAISDSDLPSMVISWGGQSTDPANITGFHLQASDFEVVDDAGHPAINPGDYQIRLKSEILSRLNGQNANYTFAIGDTAAHYTILNQANLTISGQQLANIYGETQVPLDYRDFTLTANVDGRPTVISLQAGDVYVDAGSSSKDANGLPIEAGQYTVKLTDQCLNRLAHDSRFTGTAIALKKASVASSAWYVVSPRAITYQIEGNQTVTYNGKTPTLDATQYQIHFSKLSDSASSTASGVAERDRSHLADFWLKAGDLEFVQASPTNAGTYNVRLTKQGLRHLQDVAWPTSLTTSDDWSRSYNWQGAVSQDADGNFVASPITGNFTIQQEALTVTVNDKSATVPTTSFDQLTFPASDYVLTINDADGQPAKDADGNPLTFNLQNGQVAYTDGVPSAVGEYAVSLTRGAQTLIKDAFGTNNYTYTFDSNAHIQVTRGQASLLVSGSENVPYTGHSVSLDVSQYHLVTHFVSGDATNDVPNRLLVFFRRTDDGHGHFTYTKIENPTNVGTYWVGIDPAVLPLLEEFSGGDNYNWSTNYVPYTIHAVNGTASLSGTVSKSYDGTPISDLSNLQVSVTYPGQKSRTYSLQSGDYEFVKDGHHYATAPRDAGTYDVIFTPQGLANIAKLGNVVDNAGNVLTTNVNWPRTNITSSAHYIIGTIRMMVSMPDHTQVETYDGTEKALDVSDFIPQISAGTVEHPVAVPTIPTTGENAFTADDYTIKDQAGNVVAHPTDAGTYYVYLNDNGIAKLQNLSGNFVLPTADSLSSHGTLKIKAAARTITEGSLSRTYQGDVVADGDSGNTVLAAFKRAITDAGYNATGITVDDLEWWQNGTTDYGTSASGPKDAGVYDIRLNNTGKQHLAAANPNYDLTVTDFKYTINKAKAIVGINPGTQEVDWNGEPITINVADFKPTITVRDNQGHQITNPTDDSGQALTVPDNVVLTPSDYEFVDSAGHVISSFAHYQNRQPASSTPFKVGTYHIRLNESGWRKLESVTNNYDWSYDPASLGTIKINPIAPTLTLTGYGTKVYDGQAVSEDDVAATDAEGYPLMHVGIDSSTSTGAALLIEIPLREGDYSWQLAGQPLSQAPKNVAIYNVVLNKDHFTDSLRQLMTQNTDYTGAIDLTRSTFANTSTLFYITPATISAVNLSGHSQQPYDGAPANVTLTNLVNGLNATGLVGRDHLGTNGLTGADFVWYQVNPATHTETKLADTPSAVGHYVVKLNEHGLQTLQAANHNYRIFATATTTTPAYAAVIDGGYDYQITPATASANFGGANDKTYSGDAITTADINNGGSIAVTITIPQGNNSAPESLTYQLQDGDYSWQDTPDHQAPTNAGTYTINFNRETLLNHLRQAIAANSLWKGAATLDSSGLGGTAKFTIDQKAATVSFSGSDNSAVYTGDPISMPLAKLKAALSATGLVNGEHLNTDGLGVHDFRGFQGSNELNYIHSVPVDAGNYSFILKNFDNLGLATLQRDNPNYSLSLGTNGYNYTVQPAVGQASLSGDHTTTYTGQAENNLAHNYSLVLSTTTPVKNAPAYTLADGDLQFSKDGSAWTTTVPVDAGTYQVELSPAGWQHIANANKGNNDITWPTSSEPGVPVGTYTIKQASATVGFASGNQSVSYDGQPGQFNAGGQFAPKIATNNGQTISVPSSVHLSIADGDYEFNGHVLTTEPTDLGSYQVTLSPQGLAKLESNTTNYHWSNATSGQYVINRTTGIKVTLANVSGGQTVTYKGSQFANSDLVAGNYAVTLSNGQSYVLQNGDLQFVAGQDPTNAGTYQVQLSAAGMRHIADVDGTHYDYDLNHAGVATFTIAKATPMANLTGSAEKTYDGTAITGYAPTVTISAPGSNTVGLVAGTDYVWNKGGRTYTAAPTDAGDYTVTLTNAGLAKVKAVNAANLDWNNVSVTGSGQYIIDQAQAVINLSHSHQQSATWTGHAVDVNPADFVPTISDTTNHRTITMPTSVHLTAGDYTVSQDGRAVTAMEPGAYSVALTASGWQKIKNAIADNGNYQWSSTGAGQLTISKAAATIKLSGHTSTIYSGQNAALPVDHDGHVTGLTVTLSNGLSYQLKPEDLTFVANQHTNVGTYQLVLSPVGVSHIEALDPGNYNWSYDHSQGTLAVTPAIATYKLSGSQSKYYDGSQGSLTANGHYQVQITLNNGQTVTYQLHNDDLTFAGGTAPVNRGIYRVGLSATGLANLQAINPNYQWDQAHSSSTATYHIEAGVMSVDISGTANNVFNGHDQPLTQDQVNSLMTEWGGSTAPLDGVTTTTLTPDDIEYVQQDNTGKWVTVTPHNAGTYGVRLKQSAIDRLNAANATSNYTFVPATDVAATYIINQRQARLTLTGSQTDSYGYNGPLDVSNFHVQLTNTADGVPVTITTLQDGDLLIQGYGAGQYPTDVGNYQVEIQPQLVNRLENEYPNYRFTADEVMPTPTHGSGNQSVTNGSGTNVVDRNNNGQYIILALDANIVLKGNQTVTYGRNIQFRTGSYTLQLIDSAGNEISGVALTPSDFQLDGVTATKPGVGTYHVSLTPAAINRIQALGLNNSGTNNYNWLPADDTQATLTVTAEPVTVDITNANTDPQSSVYGQAVALDNGHYRISLTPQDAGESPLTYDLQPGDLAFVSATPTNVGTYEVALSPTGLQHLADHFGSNYIFTPSHHATYRVNLATPTVTITPSAAYQKVYDGQSATIASGDYQFTFTTNNGLPIITSLNGNDLQFVGAAPTNAGDYEVQLRQSAIDRLARENPNYDWSQVSHVGARYRIAKAKATVSLDPVRNQQTGTFNNGGQPLDLSQFIPQVEAGGLVTPVIPTSGVNALTTDDYTVIDDQGHAVSQIKNAGTYTVRLNPSGLAKLSRLSNNFNWPSTVTGNGQVVISPATADAQLTKNYSKTYDGHAVDLAELNNGGVNVSFAMNDNTQVTYHLIAGDYSWNTSDGQAPVNAGNYVLSLTKSGVQHLQNTIDRQYGVGNVRLADVLNTTNVAINPFTLVVTIDGAASVPAGTTTIPDNVYSLHYSSGESGSSLPSGLSQPTNKLGGDQLHFVGHQPAVDSAGQDFTVGYDGKLADLQHQLGNNYIVSYAEPTSPNYHVGLTSTQRVEYVYVKNGEVVKTLTPLTGNYGSSIAFDNTANMPANWVMADGQTAPLAITINGGTTKILIQHGTEVITKDDPEQWPSGVKASDFQKDVTRTIVVTTPDGHSTTDPQVVSLSRTAVKDLVDNKVITWNPWSTGTWSAFSAPQISGYQPSQATVEAQTVTADTPNANVDITYTPNGKQPTNKTTPASPTTPTSPTSPTAPTEPTQATKQTNGTNPTGPTSPTSPTTPTAPTQVTKQTNATNPTAPTSPTSPTTPTAPTQVTKQTNATNPTAPTSPTTPTTPTEPTQVTKQTSATNPQTPTEPTQATKQTNPTTPTSPTSPTTPTAPTQITKQTNVTNPTAPTTPTEPTQATKQTSGTTPTGPTSPTNPTTPTEPTQVTKQTSATNPQTPTEPTQVTKQTSATNPQTPSEPTQATKQTNATNPQTPTEPTQVTKQTSATNPQAPTEPTQVTKQTSATNPQTPTEPTNLTSLTEPNQPSNQTNATNAQIPTEPNSPTNPQTPTSPNSPTNQTTPTTPAGPTNPAKPTTSTNQSASTIPQTPTSFDQSSNNGQINLPAGTDQIDEHGVAEHNTNSINQFDHQSGMTANAGHRQSGQLPQTGNQQSRLGIIGLLGMILTTLLGLGRRKKDHQDE